MFGKLKRWNVKSNYKLYHHNRIWNWDNYAFIVKYNIVIFRVEFIQLALEYKPLNLGQGLPDDLIPEYAVKALRDVATEPAIAHHQYTRGFVSNVKY